MADQSQGHMIICRTHRGHIEQPAYVLDRTTPSRPSIPGVRVFVRATLGFPPGLSSATCGHPAITHGTVIGRWWWTWRAWWAAAGAAAIARMIVTTRAIPVVLV